MTDATAGKVQISNFDRYKSLQPLDYASVPWRLYTKALKLFWDPESFDYSKDVETWGRLSEGKKRVTAFSVAGLMLGEEAVTYDILPLLRCMSDLGRLEDAMFLSTFLLEEARHTHFMRIWLDSVGFTSEMADMVAQIREARAAAVTGSSEGGLGGVNSGGILDSRLTQIMNRLDNDRSPESILDATLVYNHLVEGIGALSAFARFRRTFELVADAGGLPALEQGMRFTARDERRHIAYGTYLARRLLAENPGLRDYFETRWADLTEVYSVERLAQTQAQAAVFRLTEEDIQQRDTFLRNRYEAITAGRDMRADEIERSEVEVFEPETELDPAVVA